MLTIRPLTVTRFANCVPGLALMLVGVILYAAPLGAALGLPVMTIAAIGVFRGYRLGVTVSAERVVVRGLLRSRTVLRGSVRGVTFFPALRWVSSSGRLRWTPIMAFADPFLLSAGFVDRHNHACIERLMSLLGSNIDGRQIRTPVTRRVTRRRRVSAGIRRDRV